jgi:hypothetical protein
MKTMTTYFKTVFVWSRVARFFIVQQTQTGKKYQMATKFTKWPQLLPHVRKIIQTVEK